MTLSRRVFQRKDNARGPGHCWHCGEVLQWENRKQGLPGAWHVDHWPVRKCDIVDQWCWGIRNIHDESNLVPSCAACNTSHRWERRYWYWGNRSQCPCTTPKVVAGLALLCLVSWGALLWQTFD